LDRSGKKPLAVAAAKLAVARTTTVAHASAVDSRPEDRSEVSALAKAAEERRNEAEVPDRSWGAMRLSGLLAATADRHPDRPAFRDQPDRESWSGRPRLAWSYSLAAKVISRLAAFFAGLGLKPDSPIGICLPGGSEAVLTLLAVEQAGYRPCLMPVAWSERELERALDAAGVQAVVTQSLVGELRPAELFCAIAARTFGLRFLCAYGPNVPDGVIELDRIILSEGAAGAPPEEAETHNDPGLITFGTRAGAARPLHRTGSSLVAAAVSFLVAAKIEPGDRILTLLAPDDLRGLATGLAASLLSGATLESHGLFEGASLVRALEDETPTHLVAPGWLEPVLAESGLAARAGSTILVHPAPIRFKAKTPLKHNVVDVLAFEELALLARARDRAGRLALTIDEYDGQALSTRYLLRLRRDENGGIWFSGLASELRAYKRGGMQDAASLPEWRDSGFKADLFAGIVIGVS
jgi:mycobactin salicyl-AMP ligase